MGTLKISVDENKNVIDNYYLDDGISINNKGEYIYKAFILEDNI